MRLACLACAFALLVASPGRSAAARSYENCTGFITSLPAVVTSAGTWCLDGDQTSSLATGYMITINANNVVIDCNDFRIGGLAAGPDTEAAGILAIDRANITVRNCNIRGFFGGIVLIGENSSGHLVEDNRLDGNTVLGMRVAGDGSMIRRNRVLDSGGPTGADASFVYGIWTEGTSDILDNTVDTVTARDLASGTAYAIYTYLNDGGTIAGNRVRRVSSAGTGFAIGINMVGEVNAVARGNHVTGVPDGFGIRCASAKAGAIDNVLGPADTLVEACTQSGNIALP